jgi:hypothetical protein
MSNTEVTDTSSTVREAYTMHGLHLHSQGMKRLTELIAEKVVDGHASGTSSVPVITHARAPPFLSYIQKHRGN